jgi:anti-sigma factor RsiW
MNRECERFSKRIAALLDGECSAADRSRSMEHLLSCDGCLAEFEEAKALREQLRTLSSAPTAKERAAILEAAGPLLDQIAPASAPPAAPAGRVPGFGNWAPRLAAAVVVILVVALVALWPRNETRDLSSASVLTYYEYIGGASQTTGPVGATSVERGY